MMAATRDQTQQVPAGAGPCPSCGAAMSPDQRYCLNCGARRGAPRVAPEEGAQPPAEMLVAGQQRPADVSPLAAVIGIALLGGMLLIGVLIGRSGSDDNAAPAPIVQVDSGQTTPDGSTTTPDHSDDAAHRHRHDGLADRRAGLHRPAQRGPQGRRDPGHRRCRQGIGGGQRSWRRWRARHRPLPNARTRQLRDLRGYLHGAPAGGPGAWQARRRFSGCNGDRGQGGPTRTRAQRSTGRLHRPRGAGRRPRACEGSN